MVFTNVRPSVRLSVDGHLVSAISQQRLELGISYSLYRLIFMRVCADVTFRRTLTFDLATVTLTLKILVRVISQQPLELGISYSVYKLIFMRGCANVTFCRTLTFDLATVTLTLKILSA